MTPYLQDADVTLYHGDVLDVLREMEAESVDCCVTSPPFWGLRDYGTGRWEGGDEGRHRDAALGPKGSAKQHRTDRETLGFTDCGCSSRDDGNEQTEVRRSSFASSADSKYRPGIVLDPFMGSGTVAFVARKLGRRSVGIDLSAEYLDLAAKRLQQQSLFALDTDRRRRPEVDYSTWDAKGRGWR